MNEIFQKPAVMIFYPSYFQKSHIFIRDELSELSKYLNVNIYTFNPFFRETSFSHNNYRVFYDARFDTLYQPDVYPYLYRYSETQKRVYAIWISYMTQEVKKYSYTTCITEFLSDGVFLSLLKKTLPACKFLTFCRGKDIYTSFQKFPSSLQQKIFQSHDIFYVMDYLMQQKLIDM